MIEIGVMGYKTKKSQATHVAWLQEQTRCCREDAAIERPVGCGVECGAFRRAAHDASCDMSDRGLTSKRQIAMEGNPMKNITVVVVVLAVLAACATPTPRSAKRITLENSGYLVTDASQRIVAATSLGNFSRPGLADPNEIVCSEPSPDVATTIATSFAGAVSVFGKGSASLSASQIENMAQLVERTATIQLLRDKMYQSCLAYANGAISGTTYSLIMAQLDKTIVSLLLGENAAGAFGRSGAALGSKTNATSESAVSSATGSEKLDKAVDAVAEAQAALAAAEQKNADVQKEKGDACAAEKATESGAGAACNAIALEAQKVKQAENRLQATLRVLQSVATNRSTASAEATDVNGVGSRSVTPSADLARELRLMQDNYLSEESVDLFIPTCMVELGLHNESGSTVGRVLDYLIANYEAVLGDEARASGDELKAVKERRSALEMQLQSLLGNPQALIEKLAQDGTLESSNDAHSRLFAEVLSRWRDGVSKDNRKLGIELVSINDLAAAANLNRRSLLAARCTELLPDHLKWSRLNEYNYKKARLQSMERLEAASRGERGVTERARLLEQFNGAMAACKAGDEKLRATCETTVQAIMGIPEQPINEPEGN